MEAHSLKENNRKIARERDRYLAIFQSMAEPAFVVDHSFPLIAVNRVLALESIAHEVIRQTSK